MRATCGAAGALGASKGGSDQGFGQLNLTQFLVPFLVIGQDRV